MKNNLKHIVFFARLVFNKSRAYIIMSFLFAMIQAVQPFVLIFLPMIVIDLLLVQRAWRDIVIAVVAGGLLWLILGLCANALDNRLSMLSKHIKAEMDLLLDAKMMRLAYEKLEDPRVKEKIDKAVWTFENYGGIEFLFKFIFSTVADLISTVLFAVILLHLSVFAFGIVCVGVSICFILGKRIEKVNVDAMDAYSPLNRMFIYHLNMSGDHSLGKEIRLFGYDKLILKRTVEMIHKWKTLENDVYRKISCLALLQLVVSEVVRGFAFIYLANILFTSVISIGVFFSYILAINNFTQNMQRYLINYTHLSEMSYTLALYKEVFEMEEQYHTAERGAVFTGTVFSLEFRHVYFRYPSSENYTLIDINFTITSGEQIALVGINGSGKTTIVKLICNLYVPTEGSILLNGVPIQDYENYHEFISVVFQDFKLFPATVGENIMFDSKYKDEVYARELLKKIAFPDILLDQLLDTSFQQSAIDLSGGENQKLAIVCALYQRSAFLIMDEPTASLDPMTEANVFRHMRQLISSQSSLIISHRLFSCRYCHKVYVIDGGRIIEAGSHDELLAKDTQYKRLWDAQAQYYQ